MAFNWNRQSQSDAALNLADATSISALQSGVTDEQRAQVASLLVEFYTYLKSNAPSHPGLASAVQQMHSAVAAYQSGQSEDPYGPIKRVYAAIEAERQIDPSIPQP